jgi:hypothetical protein
MLRVQQVVSHLSVGDVWLRGRTRRPDDGVQCQTRWRDEFNRRRSDPGAWSRFGGRPLRREKTPKLPPCIQPQPDHTAMSSALTVAMA